jgi:predicted NUDIX family NTP pyrophosphohydrolase
LAQSEQKSQFAGCLLYQAQREAVEVLLLHPAGRSKKWTIPQVEVSGNENFSEAAAKFTSEVAGVTTSSCEYLGSVEYPKRRLHCFFSQAKTDDEPTRHSLEFDGARFFPLHQAQQLLDKRQKQLLDSLTSTLQFYSQSA